MTFLLSSWEITYWRKFLDLSFPGQAQKAVFFTGEKQMSINQDFTALCPCLCIQRWGREIVEHCHLDKKPRPRSGDLYPANQVTVEADLGRNVPAIKTKQLCFSYPAAHVGRGAFVIPNQGKVWVTINPAWNRGEASSSSTPREWKCFPELWQKCWTSS